jgi:very-short-patch-repair endonuclease
MSKKTNNKLRDQIFERRLNEIGISNIKREYKFDKITNRKYRLDYYIPDSRIGIEINGGVWSKGAHGRAWGIIRDYEKNNLALMNGIVVIQVLNEWIFNTNKYDIYSIIKAIHEDRKQSS